MNDTERVACYAAEEEFVALRIPAAVEDDIEEGWTSGEPAARKKVARLLLAHAPPGSEIETVADARRLLRRLYRC